jgi:hypothetical protein
MHFMINREYYYFLSRYAIILELNLSEHNLAMGCVFS